MNIYKYFTNLEKMEGFKSALKAEYIAFSILCESKETFETWAKDEGINLAMMAQSGKNYIECWKDDFIEYMKPAIDDMEVWEG